MPGISDIKIHRKPYGPVMQIRNSTNPDGSELDYLTFPALECYDMVQHAVSTRFGGVSKGIFSSMNLSFTRGDDDNAVRENFRRYARLFHTTEDHFVLSYQTHTVNVREITEEDAGKGLTRERGFTDVDGLVTNVPGLVLGIFAADCIPLLFLDPVHKAIGASHAGWRGTVGRIGRVTVEKMHALYGTEPKDLICTIGPGICQDCYEVSADVADQFMKEFPQHVVEILRERATTDQGERKFLLDLYRANTIVLKDAGVLQEHISITDICTCCNPALLFSHRFTHGRRGNNAVFIKLQREH